MKNKKISIKTIAAECGVGIGTVSRYFNGGYVSQEKRLLIQKVVEKYNFQPDFAAHSIKKKMLEVYILIPDLTSSNTFIVKSILKQINNDFTKIVPFVVETTYDEDRYLLHLQEIVRRNPAALILFTISNDENIRAFLQTINIPIIVYGRQWGDTVFINNDNEMMYALLQKMAKNHEFDKKKEILYIGENPVTNLPTGFARYDTVADWFNGRNYRFQTHFFSENQERIIWELVKTINLNNKIIIAGTHTCYKVVISFLMKNNITNSLVTDICNSNDFFLSILPKHYYIAINYSELATKIIIKLKQILDGNNITKDKTIECLSYEIKTFLK
ncbi:LacI family DNA-binding transcriptional regulator [Spiroplasma citri]|uniref:LacI family DNA-binding transcriptional regulator n=1 Tax=Spiroplasma citri TaxID=2133 RepID=A0AAX3T004_SPICI|nr:LacI family DNA-binding transcriptional regulator [Spiroplasma citri]WFG96881.1 LacI family DNA-binding transcriptional regulator [Spiroplasma citri]WFH00779.1 LacI family DNA-binding transcriptional regulator [Spiroplasma citri]